MTIPVVQSHEVYLGMPTFSLRNKKVQFGFLVEKGANYTTGWESKLFFADGKEVLIKAVLQAIPSYTMSCFRIPKSTCYSMEKMCADFWWGSDQAKLRMHWATWQILCLPKCHGGLGFRKMDIFNKALLAKQIWRIVQNPTSLVARVLKARYFKHLDIMQASTGNNPSYIWRSLLWGREILREGMHWRIGNGLDVDISKDSWIPSLCGKLGDLAGLIPEGSKVSYLIQNYQWNETLIRGLCLPFIAEEILKIPLSNDVHGDSRFWKSDSKGKYSVRSGYRLEIGVGASHANTSNLEVLQKWWKFLWAMSIPPKIRLFWWKDVHNFIPTGSNLHQHHVPVPDWCPLCRFQEDTTSHALFFCPIIKSSWKECEYWSILKRYKGLDMMDICLALRSALDNNQFEELMVFAWMIWNERCRATHSSDNQVNFPIPRSAARLLQDYKSSSQSISKAKNHDLLFSQTVWKAPQVDCFRLDADASFDAENNRCGGLYETIGDTVGFW